MAKTNNEYEQTIIDIFLSRLEEDGHTSPQKSPLLNKFFRCLNAWTNPEQQQESGAAPNLESLNAFLDLQRATRRPATRILAIPHREQFAAPPWMPKALSKHLFSLHENDESHLAKAIQHLSKALLEWEQGFLSQPSLEQELGEERLDALEDVENKEKIEAEQIKLENAYKGICPFKPFASPLKEFAQHTFCAILLYTYVAQAVDDVDMQETITYLFERILPYALPLGEKVDEPGTWIVLVR